MSQHSLNPAYSLRGKLLIAFLVAIFLPLALVVYFSITGATEISQQNLAERLLENGLQHTTLLQTQVSETVSVVQQYLAEESNRSRLRDSLLPASETTRNRVVRLNDAREALVELMELLPDHVAGAWVMPELSNNADIFVAAEGSDFTPRAIQLVSVDSAAEVRANNILLESEYWLVSGDFEGIPYLAMASPLITGSGADAQRRGYVVVALDINSLLIAPLVLDTTLYRHDSFVLLPDGLTTLALDGTVFAQPPVTIEDRFRAGVIN
ncbi:MAG: hypothetical protein KC496_15170, partial [Anaerolineae bacterium]|nr:hypothetical protein [Anaerolineae bacterium]